MLSPGVSKANCGTVRTKLTRSRCTWHSRHFLALYDTIGHISQAPIRANVEVDTAVMTIKCYVHHIVCDNLGLHDLFEPYTRHYIDEMHVVQCRCHLQQIKQSNSFVHVPQAFIRNTLTKLVVDRQVEYVKFEVHMLVETHMDKAIAGIIATARCTLHLLELILCYLLTLPRQLTGFSHRIHSRSPLWSHG